MQIEVISLGGSVLVPDQIDYSFLKKFKRLLMSFHNRKFVVVTGGGRIARIYIEALKKEGLSVRNLSYAGIAITRINAKFLANFFVKKQHYPIPTTLKEVKNLLKKHDIVFCGALRYEPDNTSDGTAAEIAWHVGGRFINITNVKGLYTKDPRKHRDARFIPRISFEEFYQIAHRMRYVPGQHFVLDQHAARIIKEKGVRTYIVGKDLTNLKSFLHGKRFVGTMIG